MQRSLPKPREGQPCNGCGLCCIEEPCGLAREFLGCNAGPCVALERAAGRTLCGLVRNPLGYLFQATHPREQAPLSAAPASELEGALSAQIAQALGVGRGCDAAD